ncbi:ATP-binding protein [Desulfocicer niacini]
MATRLFLFVAMAIFLVIGPLSYMAVRFLENFGSYAASVNETHIWKLSSAYLSRIVVEQARKADVMFQRITAVSSLMGERGTVLYNSLEQHSRESWADKNLVFSPSQDIFFSSPSDKVVTLYWGGKEITPDIEMEIKAISHLEPLLLKAKTLVTESFATHLISASGVGMYCATTPETRQLLFELPNPSVFDLRDGEPMSMFLKDPSGISQTRWTRLYKDDVNNDMTMTASTSIYDASGTLKAIVGIDVSLGHLLQEAFKKEDRGRDASKILFSFLMNDQGRLIIFPREYFDRWGLEVDLDQFTNSSDTLDYRLQDSRLANIRAVADKILRPSEQILDLEIEGENYILVTASLNSLDWHLVIVTRENDLKSSIQQTQAELDTTLKSLEYHFFMFHAGIVVFVLVFMYWMIRLFVLPVKQLTQSIEKVTHGDLAIRVPVKRKDELGELTMAFNGMVERLEVSAQSESKLMKKVLRVTDMLNGIFDSSTEYAILATDLQFRVLHYNPASETMFGNTVEMDLGLDIRKIHGDNDGAGAAFEKGVQQVRNFGSYQFEWVHYDVSKRRHVVSSTLMPMKNRKQGLIGYLLFSRDVSSYQELQSRLLRSDRLAVTGQLAASVAHQINSPLQGISAFISLMKETASADVEMMECLDALTRGFESIRNTVENLMDLTRPGKEEKELIDINKVIQDTVVLVRLYIQQTGAELHLDLSSTLPLIHASSSQISHVILNLLNNALEAMHGQVEDKQISITSFFIDGGIEIQLQDTGPGIAKENIDYVFDPFYTTKNVLGMGVGLSVCNGFIENHGGSIQVENMGLRGACFTIRLPIA